jgi:hypothetical protein
MTTTPKIAAGINDFIAQENEQKATILRDNWVNSASTSPDDFAKQIALSRATGIPPQSLMADPEFANKQRALLSTDFTGLTLNAPKTANFFLDETNAGLARDDSSLLGSIEGALSEGWRVTKMTGKSLALGGTAGLAAAARNVSAAVYDYGASAAGMVGAEGAEEYMRALATGNRADAKRAEDWARELADPRGFIEESIYSGGQSAGMILPVIATIPLAMSEAYRNNMMTPGDWIVMSAFGAGFTWGSLLLKWAI